MNSQCFTARETSGKRRAWLPEAAAQGKETLSAPTSSHPMERAAVRWPMAEHAAIPVRGEFGALSTFLPAFTAARAPFHSTRSTPGVS